MILLLKKLFYPIYFILFILSFFLIEGDYKFYLFALWSFFILIYSKILIEKKRFFSQSIFLAFILSVSFLIVSIFSNHIPLSIEKLLFYLLSLEIFVFFKILSKKYFSYKLFVYYLSIVTLILNILVLFFTFFDFHYISFPTMNLLTRIYGHNHYAAFLLLVIPIFWWQVIFFKEEKWNKESENRFLPVILLLLSYFIIIVSLSRISLLISILQLIFIFLINKGFFFSFNRKKFIFGIVKFLMVAFILIAIVYLLLPLFSWNNDYFCPSIFSKKYLCQPLQENVRFAYWKTAWSIFEENFIFGSGLKTFNYSSRYFPSEGFQLTSYAHNIFLHNLSEGGLVGGGIFIIFIMYIYHKSFLNIKNRDEHFYKFLWIASISSLINALFDYDWHFFVIFSLTLIFLAIILQDEEEEKKFITSFNVKAYFVIIALIANFFSFSYVSAEILRAKNHPDIIINFFPYFNQQITSLMKNSSVSSKEKELTIKDYEDLWFLYKEDPTYILKYLEVDELSLDKRMELMIKLADLDHRSFLFLYSKHAPFTKLNYTTELAKKKITIIKKQNLLSNHEILTYTTDDRKKDAMEFVLLAEKLYEEEDYETAAYFYNEAINFYPKIYNNKKLPFEYDKNISATTEMLLRLNLQTDDFELYGYDYDMQFVNCISTAWENDHLDLAITLTEKLPINYRYYHLIFKNILEISKFTDELNKEIKQNNLNIYFNKFKEKEEWNSFDLSFIIVND